MEEKTDCPASNGGFVGTLESEPVLRKLKIGLITV
jgi:hypothetical protein